MKRRAKRMGFKVVYNTTTPIDLDKESFAEIGADYVETSATKEDDIIAATVDADALIARDGPFNKKVISGLKKCRLIMTPKIGYDNIDVTAATEAGICVANQRGLSADEVSDHAMALLLACARKIVRLDKMVKAGGWRVFHGREMQAMWRGISQIRGQTLGLIGFGAIPRTLVPKAKGFGMRILAYDAYLPAEDIKKLGVEPAGLDQVLQESDYVSIHTPLTPETRHMLGLAQFKMMKPTAYLINTARGPVVDEAALYTALTGGDIAGAGLDVLEAEPAKMDNPLLKLDNVIVTGHSGFYSDQMWAEQSRIPAQEVGRIMSGEWPKGWLNPEVEPKYIARWGKMGKK
jgi:D-3-phosphoglycerate dehydrogenase